MHQPYKINLINALVFVIAGLIGFVVPYLQINEFSSTALTLSVIGLLLLVMTPGMKKENTIVRRMVFVLTLFLSILGILYLMQDYEKGVLFERRSILIIVVILSSLVSVCLYLLNRNRTANSGS